MKHAHYRKLAIMLPISFVIMYSVMFLNVESSDHIYLSATRAYMSLLMVTPMAVLMLLLMPGMYQDRKRNAAIIAASVIVFLLSLTFLRSQTFIQDVQYLKAMMPHHSSAILTSRNATITDPEVKRLAEQIIRSQEREISEMKAMLDRLQHDQ